MPNFDPQSGRWQLISTRMRLYEPSERAMYIALGVIVLLGILMKTNFALFQASPMLRLLTWVVFIAFGVMFICWGSRPYTGYLVQVSTGENRHESCLLNSDERPRNGGKEVTMLSAMITTPSGDYRIDPLWLEFRLAIGHRQAKIHSTVQYQHLLNGWSVWTDDPRERFTFMDPERCSRTVTNDSELAEVFQIILDGQTFHDFEESRRIHASNEQEWYRDLMRRAYAVHAYLESTKRAVNGQPMRELRSVFEEVFPPSLFEPIEKLGSDSDRYVVKIRSLVPLKYGDWAKAQTAVATTQTTVETATASPSNVDG